MKHFLLSVLLGLLVTNTLFAQGKLTSSRTSSTHTYIYQLNDQEAFRIAEKSKLVINDSFFHTLVDSFYTDPTKPYRKTLAYGSYLYVRAEKNELSYRLVPVMNVDLRFFDNRKDYPFIVLDLKGNISTDAVLYSGKGKKIPYDEKSKSYLAAKLSENTVITVRYQGINNYFLFKREEVKKPKKDSRAQFMPLPKENASSDYKGYMIFSKPKYKPNDTVRLKAYVVKANGAVIKDRVFRLSLKENYNREGIDKVLTVLKPHREGAYSHSFVLSDSLGLRLDRTYEAVLQEQKGDQWREVIRNNFRYEDYELKSVSFTIRADRQSYRPGQPINLYLKASDENDLAVADGRVTVQVLTSNVKAYPAENVFVKDSLWSKELKLDPVGETKLVIPDSIFPKADLNFRVNAVFLNSNNERRNASQSLSFERKTAELKAGLKSDSLQLDYLENGKSLSQQATVYAGYHNTHDIDSLHLTLPSGFKLNPLASNYEVKLSNGYAQTFHVADFNADIQLSVAQHKDSLQVVVDNPNRIPFWYTVFSDDKIMFRRYALQLDTLIKHSGKQTAHVRLDYLWDDQQLHKEVRAVYVKERLQLKLLAPDVVYPGQRVNMQVRVTDAEDRPVAETDLTALAHTAKFGYSSRLDLPYFGKEWKARMMKPEAELDNISNNGQLELNWKQWNTRLGLDTITYYQFTQSKDLFVVREPISDTMAVVLPFAVRGGAILPIHILYIDEIPVFFSQADQLQRYAFRVKPGRHSIRMRTAGYMLSIDNYEFVKGQKTILSAFADPLNEKVRVSVAPDELTIHEAELLNKYMIRIENTFQGQPALLKTDHASTLLNPPSAATQKKNVLVGPFRENYLNFVLAGLDQHFLKEPGYTYTFLPNLLKQKSYDSKYAFSPMLTSGTGALSYEEDPLKEGEIDSIWTNYLNLRSRSTHLFNNGNVYGPSTGRLVMKLDSSLIKGKPYLKNVLIYKDDEPGFLQIYPGNNDYFIPLEGGVYRMIYLFKDNSYFVIPNVNVLPSGYNYFVWKQVDWCPTDLWSDGIDQKIKSVGMGDHLSYQIKQEINEQLNGKYFDPGNLVLKMTGRILNKQNQALPGVSVRLAGANYEVVTDIQGKFTLNVPKKGNLVIKYIGYLSREIQVKQGDVGDIILEDNNNALEEVVVVGYGAQKKQSMLSAVTVSELRTAPAVEFTKDMVIRGVSSIGGKDKPLVIIDGIPSEQDVNDIDFKIITEMNVLKGADATAIYGSRGINGVIIIKTKGGNLQSSPAAGPQEQMASSRSKFSDEAIWQPKLVTNAEGKVSFSVTFPDDITKWTTRIIAMNGRKQSGLLETSIRSFKTLSANLVSPQFAIAGDSIRLIGKLMNYNNMEESVLRRFSYNGEALLSTELKFKNAHIDTLGIRAANLQSEKTDSLNFEYSMKQDNGYFDGEIRKIPLLQAGILETKGHFAALLGDTSLNYQFDQQLGRVTLRAEASLFPTLLDEIDKLRQYEYLCNEQMASKLKALLLEKKVRAYLGESFKEEKNIKELLKKLNAARRPEGTWGWWPGSEAQLWISLHVVEALLMAEKQGYAVELDKQRLYRYLLNKMGNEANFDQIYGARLMRLLDDKHELKDWVRAIEKKKQQEADKHAQLRKLDPGMPAYKPSLYEQLQIMQLKQMAGMEIDLPWLRAQKKQTMFGSSYWGDFGYHFWDNSIQNTLLAYQILKSAGVKGAELDALSRYFLEQRKDGQWRNTYESSLILQTILPDLIVEGKKPRPASIVLNNTERITEFPFHKQIDPATLSIKKTGDAPVYFTAYQQFNNPKPEKVSKDFSVKTELKQNGVVVKDLKAGTLASIEVEVQVRADADYVMIEIPIPAGCSYENKVQSFWGVETHREYFKHKTAIFCTKLKAGKYQFSVQLLPRYSGQYILNPAKAEMMYFPVFYGREGMKSVEIK